MKGSAENKVSFATRPSKPPASSKGSDENDRSDHERGLNLGNQKKETMKNFMSTSASKASFQIKKILAERNESSESNFSNTHISKTSNLSSKSSPNTTPKPSQKNISPNFDVKFSPKKTSSPYNSKNETPPPRPYDPLINYLSPRPQFLRYDPGRRKQIFMRLQLNAKDADDDETDSCYGEDGSCSCECGEISEESGSALEQEDDEIDIESDEESEEQVGWNMRKGLKFLLLFVVLLLSTTYICSMDSPTPLQDFEFIQNSSNGTAESVVAGFKFLDGEPKGPQQWGLLVLNTAVLDKSIEEVMAESITKRETPSLELEDRHHVESSEMVEEVKTDENIENVSEEQSVKIEDASEHFSEEKATVKEIEDVEENGESGDIIEAELAETKEVSGQHGKDIELLETVESGEHIEDVEKVKGVKEGGKSENVIEEKLVKTSQIKMAQDIELVGEEYEGVMVSEEAVQASILCDGSDHRETSSDATYPLEQERVAVKEECKEIQNEATREDIVQGTIVGEVNLLQGPNQHSGTGVLVKVLFGVITCATIVASLVLGWRKAIASKHSSLLDNNSTEPVLNEKPSLVLPAQREDHHALMNTVPLVNSTDKDIEESYQRRAPSVELLSELEVGAISSCGKSCGLTTASTNNEVNSHSDFLKKDFGSKAYAAPVQDQKSFSEFTPVNSNSSQKLTAKKKLFRKEFGNDNTAGLDGREGRKEAQTPSTLRRSDRLRNRSVTSPPPKQ